ncbi:MAG: GGDEF domain-containing protein [Epsilonproteobacteria bacterium]|nr:MAG: GGDEF domain-containing protein [Campylobacterota bacterium]
MLYPEEKERENRFKLALRMGFPIFLLTGVTATGLLFQYFETIPINFFVIWIGVFAVTIYYLFYLIYQGFDERITDSITHTFTRDYLTTLFSREIKKGPFTIILISIDNLYDINTRFGTKNGDRILYEVARRIGEYFDDKQMNKIPIGHFKGGDFFIGLNGNSLEYKTMMELICIKFENYSIDDIEINISGAIVDTKVSNSLEQLIDHLFDQQNENRASQYSVNESVQMKPDEIEISVINAVKNRSFALMYQSVISEDKIKIVDLSVKLKGNKEKLLHQKNFMPVIGRLGLLREFDTALVNVIVNECCTIKNNLIFSLNISPSTLRQRRFLNDMQILFKNNSMAEGKIIFILSEREYYYKTDHFNILIQAYRNIGILIALDHLGSYHSSMLYLKDLTVDLIRIDASFGKNIQDMKYQAILRGLLTSIKFIGMKSWIKMVENEEANTVAKSLKIDYLQGNYLGKIASLDTILKKETNEIR